MLYKCTPVCVSLVRDVKADAHHPSPPPQASLSSYVLSKLSPPFLSLNFHLSTLQRSCMPRLQPPAVTASSLLGQGRKVPSLISPYTISCF